MVRRLRSGAGREPLAGDIIVLTAQRVIVDRYGMRHAEVERWQILAARAAATFSLETLRGDPGPRQLQYSQTVLLNFNGLSWPHITVATLHKAA
jgi:hypothetical protein